MLHLHWQKTLGRLIILTLISVSASLHAAAQKVLYLEDHDSKPYYFGITLSAAQARFHTDAVGAEFYLQREGDDHRLYFLGYFRTHIAVGIFQYIGKVPLRKH